MAVKISGVLKDGTGKPVENWFSTGFPVPSFSTPEIFTAIFTPQKSPPEPAGCHNTVLPG
nr:hypothetical protein [Escherichia coli]